MKDRTVIMAPMLRKKLLLPQVQLGEAVQVNGSAA